MSFLLGLIVGLFIGSLLIVMYYRRNKNHMLALEVFIRKQYNSFETKIQDEATKLLNKTK
jgi:uncharacterized membrane-anchored protein YhcB (DUF1043 family)